MILIFRRISFVILILCSFFSSVNAQELSPQVISSAGAEISNSSAIMSYTIGEPLITTIQDNTNILTQGFQQPSIKVTGITSVSDLSVRIYPNPTASFVNIESDYELSYSLYDGNGKLVTQGTLDKKAVLDMSAYATATYMLSLSKGNSTSTYKIIKMN